MGLRKCGQPTPWLKAVPTKVKIFNWRLNLDRLPTKENMIKKGVALDNNLCPICYGYPETVTHIFKDCALVQEIRRLINTWWLIFSVDGTVLNNQKDRSKKSEIAKEVVHYALRWLMWKKMNEVVFKSAPFISSLLANDIQATTFSWFHNRCNLGSSVSWLDWCCSPSSL